MSIAIDTTSSETVIQSVLALSELELLQYWASLKSRERVALLLVLSEVQIYTEQTYYSALKKAVAKPQPLPPITAFRLANKLATVKNKTDLDAYLKAHNITLKDVALADLKPIMANSMRVLMGIYLCSSYEDAYSYVEMGKLLKDADITKSKEEIWHLLEAHTNLNLLLSWYRMAVLADYYDYGVMIRRASGEKVEESADSSYPPTSLLIDLIVTTTDIIDRMRFLPKIIIRSLRESTDINQFFTVVDSIVVNLAHQFNGDELKIRRRMAFMSMVRDVMDDTIAWRDMVAKITKTK